MGQRRIDKSLWSQVGRLLCCFLTGFWLAIALSLPSLSLGSGTLASLASTDDIDAHIAAGLDAYHQGRIPAAIATWQHALDGLQEGDLPKNHLSESDSLDVSTSSIDSLSTDRFQDEEGLLSQYPRVLQYLARGYRDLGKSPEQVEILDQLIAYYQSTQNTRQLGRMQTEKAAAYQRQGHYHRADALLCSEESIESSNVLSQSSCHPESAIYLAQMSADAEGELAAWGRLGTGYWNQGHYGLALDILSDALSSSQQLPNSPHQTALLNSLGSTYASLGQQHYRYAQLAQQTNDTGHRQEQQEQARFYDDSAVALFEAAFEQSRDEANPIGELHSLLNLIPIYRRSFPDQIPDRGEGALTEAKTIFAQLPPSHEQLQVGLKLALLWQTLMGSDAIDAGSLISTDPILHCSASAQPEALALLDQLKKTARQLGDSQMVAATLGYQGTLAECAGDGGGALQLFYQAQLASDRPEQRYQWEWQSGQLLAQQGQLDKAIAFYEQAVQSITAIRTDLAGANRDLQLNVRDQVEGLYRQLADLKLQQLERLNEQSSVVSAWKANLPGNFTAITPQFSNTGDIQAQDQGIREQKTLAAVLDTIDGLRLTELQNYLGDDCELPLLDTDLARGDGETGSINRPQTAVINSILFSDRIAVILTTMAASEEPHYSLHWIPMGQGTFTDFVNDFRFNLEKRSDLTQRFRPQAQQLYDWLVRPFESELQRLNVDSLIFIHDGILRSVPMAVLHDGSQFLAETYNIFNTPSLKIAPSAPLQLAQENAVLAFGLTQASTIDSLENAPLFPPSSLSSQGQTIAFNRRKVGDGTLLTPLPAVQLELGAIQQLLPNSQVFFDTDFTRDRLRQELSTDAPQVLHLATHARFGFDSQQTYLVTGQQVPSASFSDNISPRPQPIYNDTINLNELYRLIKQTQTERANSKRGGLDFLVLTACETAVGSDRDALGLAGIAVQAGVKSSLASLWQVDDQVTADLIRQFYQNLAQGHPKATALRLAQQQWLTDHPTGRYSHPGYWAPFVLVGME